MLANVVVHLVQAVERESRHMQVGQLVVAATIEVSRRGVLFCCLAALTSDCQSSGKRLQA